MKIIGFRINKIECKKNSEKVQDLKINSSIDILSIKEINLDSITTSNQMVSIEFKHTLEYSPEYAKMELQGDMIIEEQPKTLKKIMEQWKDKKLPAEFKVNLFNWIIRKTTIKMLELEEDLNLPPHINFPLLKIIQEKDKKE